MSTLSIAPAFDTSDRLSVVPPARAVRPALGHEALMWQPVRQSTRRQSGPDRSVQQRSAPERRTHQGQSGAAQSSVRLTRRGRLAVFLGTLAVALTASFFLGAGAVGTEESGTPAPTEIVMVGTGDTLWGIAAEVAGDADIRDVMTEIERLNALDGPALMAGQKLRVPAAE